MNEARYWTLTFAELEIYFGIRRGGRSHYLAGKDFRPDILAQVQPKQLVDTETHPGFVPVKMGEDGRRVINKTVEKMLGGIPYEVMRKALTALDQADRDVYGSFMAVQRRSPLTTMDDVAASRNIGIATLYRHLRHALDFVSWYLDNEAEGWPEGAAVS